MILNKQKSSTLFLKLVIICMALIVLAIIGIALPYEMINNGVGSFLFFFVFLYLTAIPFYIALYQGWKLLSYINSNTAFSGNSVKALKIVKYCGAIMFVLYLACYPWMYITADLDDAPGILLIWAVICGAPLVISVFAALLEMVLQNVISIKSENDLTV